MMKWYAFLDTAIDETIAIDDMPTQTLALVARRQAHVANASGVSNESIIEQCRIELLIRQLGLR